MGQSGSTTQTFAFNGSHIKSSFRLVVRGIYLDIKMKIRQLTHLFRKFSREYITVRAHLNVSWYISSNPDVANADADPIAHYLEWGAYEGRWPTPLFDDEWYRFAFPDYSHHTRLPFVDFILRGEKAGLTPNGLFDSAWYADTYNVAARYALKDYIAHSQIRNPHPLFDTKWYIDQYPEVINSEYTPLSHYLIEGARKGYNPHPLFDAKFYEERNKKQRKIFDNPLIDYLVDREKWSNSTHPLFDGAWYLRTNVDVGALGINPLRHFVQSGWSEGRAPSPLFQTKWYMSTYAGVIAPGTNPVLDYMAGGAVAGRNPNTLFDSAWYLLHNGDVAGKQINPLIHYITSGWVEGCDPGPKFDSAWYQFRYPDADRAGINPLTHYFTVGSACGHLTRAPDRHTPDCDALDIPYEIIRSPETLTGTEVCFYITYSSSGTIHAHIVSQLTALRRTGLKIVLIVVTSGLTQSLAPVADLVDGLLLRVNHGWDFAAWATALAVFPDAWTARLLILANDSLCGPTNQDSLNTMLDCIRASEKDLVALCDSYQVKHHLLSFFTAITPSGLRKQQVRMFWNGVRSNQDTEVVINEYEIRSLERWREQGVTVDVLFPAQATDPAMLPPNPTEHDWHNLLARGFPFIKTQLLREQPQNIDIKDWQAAFRANPGLAIEIEAYLAEEPSGSGWQRPVPSPKQRFIQPDAVKTFYGATTSCRPADEVDLTLEVPFAFLGRSTTALPARVAVIAHIFYTDFCGELLEHLRHIPVPADLFVSTDSEAKRQEIEKALSAYRGGDLVLRVFPNIGRDIAPMIVGFREVFRNYDIFLHIHSKKSPHDDAFSSWREHLLTNLLGSKDVVTSILHMLTAQDIGIVFSEHFPAVRHLLNFGYNYQKMKDLLARCGVALSKDLVLEFPSSSFFWGRCAALEPLLALDLDWSDFPAEDGQIDGTTAHAIERSVLYIAEAAGFRWIKVAAGRSAPPSSLVTIVDEDDFDLALRRVHRPLLFNRIRRPKDANLVSEINPPLIRRDTSTRPRFNLIVPTLQPAKTFGGLTTAIRIFEDIAARISGDVDLRIISVSERIDLQSMLRFPDYRLIPISSFRDDLPRTVLDASERQRGYLSVRKTDIFLATAWWTAHTAYHLQDKQQKLFGQHQPVVYLIQDHEPNFYGWSSQFGEAQGTYFKPDDTISLINSEELANYFLENYQLGQAWVIPFEINPTIAASLSSLPRERIILVYGRPGTARNCFEIICQAISLWQRSDPVEAEQWRVVSAGEEFDPVRVSQVRNLEVCGKLSLQEYGDLLSRASVGVSLMASPHPSYPPLEMAYAGLNTVTNSFLNKDLGKRSENINSVRGLNAEELALALEQAVRSASPTIGSHIPAQSLADLPCELPRYEPREVARLIRDLFDRVH